MRSLLFVPGDDEKKIVKALATESDIIILDLEDSVAPTQKMKAAALVRDVLETLSAEERKNCPQIYVRINPLGDGQAYKDIDMVLPGRPNGIVLPKCQSGSDAGKASEMLVRAESEIGVTTGTVKLIAIMTETAGSLFGAGTYENAATRLIALAWGAEDLSADVGAIATRGADGHFLSPYMLARNLCLFGAAAAGLEPIDTVYVDFKNHKGLEEECAAALRDGFTGKMAIHPGQVPVINETFTPLKSSVAKARAIVDGFASAGNVGVIAIDGEMVDKPHLVRAQKIIARAELYGEKVDPKPKRKSTRRKTTAKRKPAAKRKSSAKKS